MHRANWNRSGGLKRRKEGKTGGNGKNFEFSRRFLEREVLGKIHAKQGTRAQARRENPAADFGESQEPTLSPRFTITNRSVRN